MFINVETKIKTRIMDAATGRCIKSRPWQKNLMLDNGLNSLAQKSQTLPTSVPASCFQAVQVGGGTNPNSVASGGVTFTQLGTVVTASGSFFTSGMVGSILKYGTGSGGVEYYITAFTNSTTVSVDTSATVGATVGTVWNVQQTALQTLLFKSNTYQTNSGDCSTTYSGATVTFQRTFIIAQQASPYTVNEIGYAQNTSTNQCAGRIVLSSSDVIGTTNFYVVVIAITFTYSPGSPTAVGDVGTNFVTAGNAMVESFSISKVNTSGSTVDGLDQNVLQGQGGRIFFATATYAQNSAISSVTTPTAPARIGNFAVTGVYGSARGLFTFTATGSVSTTGQTCYAVGLGSDLTTGMSFDVLLTTPVTLPTGTFQTTTVFAITYGRTLTN